MYPNPFNRKHSKMRQIIDKFFKPGSNNNKKSRCEGLNRQNSNASTCSYASTSSEKFGNFIGGFHRYPKS
nr:unnamed protein product [Callosobruchus chinensis]